MKIVWCCCTALYHGGFDWPFLVVIVIVIVVVPGRCGAKEEPFEKRGDKCQRVMLGLLLGALLLFVA